MITELQGFNSGFFEITLKNEYNVIVLYVDTNIDRIITTMCLNSKG